jgi:7-cyano-7-deazaguanine reductase
MTEPDDMSLLGSEGTDYPDSPDLARLETFANAYPQRDYLIRFDCPEFTSVCPITGQPDFAHITIEYVAGQCCIESKSLKLYLFSYRNQGAFSEAITNRILDDLVAACRPRRATVVGRFTPRGGIGITVTAEYVAADEDVESRTT